MSVSPFRLSIALIGDEIEATFESDFQIEHDLHSVRFKADHYGVQMLLRILRERGYARRADADTRVGTDSALTQAQCDEIIKAWKAKKDIPLQRERAEAEALLKELEA